MNAIICGGGIAGLTLAWWLDRYGWEVLIVERAPALRDQGYAIDFFGSGYDVAELMGLVPQLRETRYPIDEVAYVNRDGHQVSRLDYQAFAQQVDGRLVGLLTRGDLERVLFGALSDRVHVRFGLSIDAVTPTGDQVTVTLTDGDRQRADLLIGADGIHSRVRELVFGAERWFLRDLGYHTAAYVFTDDVLCDHARGRVLMVTAPGRLAGIYPFGDGKVASLFAHRSSQPALPADPRATLRRIYADLGWMADRALARCPQPPALYYDQVAQIEMPRWSRGRVALIGDACQAVSLLAGQGASMAMGGAYVLAAELGASADVATALARYEARVKPVIQRQQAAARRIATWFVPPSRWRMAARDAVLRLADLPRLGWLLRPLLSPGMDSVVPRSAAAPPMPSHARAQGTRG